MISGKVRALAWAVGCIVLMPLGAKVAVGQTDPPDRWAVAASASSFTYDIGDGSAGAYAGSLSRYGGAWDFDLRALVSPSQDASGVSTSLYAVEAGVRWRILSRAAVQPYLVFALGFIHHNHKRQPSGIRLIDNATGPLFNTGFGIEVAAAQRWHPFGEMRVRLDGRRLAIPNFELMPNFEFGGGLRYFF